MLANKVPIAVCVIAAIGFCQAASLVCKSSKEFDELQAKIYGENQAPMTSEETIEVLRELIRYAEANGFTYLKKKFLIHLSAADMGVDHCNVARFEELRYNFPATASTDFKPEKEQTNIANMLRPKIAALYKLCREEYDTKTVEGINSLTESDVEILKDLATSARDPDIYTGYRQMRIHSYFFESLNDFLKKRGDGSYDELIFEPCKRFQSKLSRVVQIGIDLEKWKQSKFDNENDKFLFKTKRVCDVALYKTQEAYEKYLHDLIPAYGHVSYY